ncbi:MAG: hypothetical protein HKN06_04010 [Gammaproteobacteria bacterium]|nr:hypothetical protein [Gammaproteobacteria bacterium]
MNGMVRKSCQSAVLVIMAAGHNIAGAAGAETEWFADTEATAIYDDNVSRAERERDIVYDKMLLANIGLAYNRELSSERAITLRSFLQIEQFFEVEGLSHSSVGGQFIYRWQNELGFSAPFYQFNTTVQFNEFRVQQRDNTEINSQFIVSKRITDSILASTGLEYNYQDSSGVVFDQSRSRWFLNADYATRSGWALYGTYSFIHGDTTSTAQAVFCNGAAAPDTFGLVIASEAIEVDQAFSDEFCGKWVSYRLNANTNMLVLGLNKGIGNSMALDFSVRKVLVNGAGDNDYDRTIFNASLLVRFR